MPSMSNMRNIIGSQGKCRIDLYSGNSQTNGSLLSSVVLDNIASKVTFDEVLKIEENYKGDNIENFNGVKVDIELTPLNIFNDDSTKIISLLNMINISKTRNDRQLLIYPLYAIDYVPAYYNFSLFVLFQGKFSIEYIVEFLNNSQKFDMKFVHKYKLNQYPAFVLPTLNGWEVDSSIGITPSIN